MEKSLCFGCMEYLDSDSERCKCGFVEKTYESEPHHLKPGTMLKERYQVGRVLGEGGFGITYVGRDMVLDMKVAVKEFYMSGYVNRNNTYSTLVRASVGSHSELFERNREKFLTEARVLAKFANEEGIVGIRDFFQENNTAYIVMDFLTGETLRDYLKANTKLGWKETLNVMSPIIKSLGTVHKHNVIHRDISPDNIMLTKDNKVKLLDFGAAREVSQTDIKSLSVILKPGYAPEEQYRSKGQQGPWTDIYALCATIYCCISGMVPEDSMERMFEDKLRPLCEVEPTCSVALSNVIARGMAVRQKDRYQSIAELQADLDKAMTNPNDASVARGEIAKETTSASQATPVKAATVADDNATVYAGEIGSPVKTASVADDNATVYAGEIGSSVKTASIADDNATVYAGEIGSPMKTAPMVDNNATVYAGEIENTVKTVEPVVEPKVEVPVQTVEVEDNAVKTAAVLATNNVVVEEKTVEKAEKVEEKVEESQKVVMTPTPAKEEVKSAPVKSVPKATVEASKQPKEKKNIFKKKDKKDKKPLPLWKKILIVLGIIIAIPVVGFVILVASIMMEDDGGDSYSDSDQVQTSTNKKPSNEDSQYVEVPEGLNDYTITINGHKITLPATYQDFVDAGWEAADPALFAEKKLEAGRQAVGSEQLINISEEYGEISVYIYNPSSSIRSLKDCWIYGVFIHNYSLNAGKYDGAKEHEIVIGKDIVFGVTTDKELLEKYPNVYQRNDEYTYGYANRESYTSDGKWIDGCYEVMFETSGKMNSVQIYCYNEPAGFVDTYELKAPDFDEEKLWETVTTDSYIEVVKGDGTEHKLTSGVKLKYYLDQGWKINGMPEFLAAGEYTDVLELKADARTSYYITLVNPYESATATEECIVNLMKFYADRVLSDDEWCIWIDGEAFEKNVSIEDMKKYLKDANLYFENSEISITIQKDAQTKYPQINLMWTNHSNFEEIGEIYFSGGINEIKSFFENQ